MIHRKSCNIYSISWSEWGNTEKMLGYDLSLLEEKIQAWDDQKQVSQYLTKPFRRTRGLAENIPSLSAVTVYQVSFLFFLGLFGKYRLRYLIVNV
jgi:hypothetical protein